jgi:hypothetical protein
MNSGSSKSHYPAGIDFHDDHGVTQHEMEQNPAPMLLLANILGQTFEFLVIPMREQLYGVRFPWSTDLSGIPTMDTIYVPIAFNVPSRARPCLIVRRIGSRKNSPVGRLVTT